MYSNHIEMLHDYERSTGNCRQSDAERLAAEIEVLEEATAHLAQSYYAAYECRRRRREEDEKLSGLLQVSGDHLNRLLSQERYKNLNHAV